MADGGSWCLSFLIRPVSPEPRGAPGSTGVTFIAPGDAAVSVLVRRLPMGV